MDARTSPGSGWKRKGGAGPRARKKQKRLDAIRDRPSPSSPTAAESPDVQGHLRRSGRIRKAPVPLDSSPQPSSGKRSKLGRKTGVAGRSKRAMKRDGKKAGVLARKAIVFVDDGGGEWGSRLRSRSGKGRHTASASTAASPVGKRRSLPQPDDREKEPVQQETEAVAESPVKETGVSVTVTPLPPRKGKKKNKKRKKKKKGRKKVELSKGEVNKTENAPLSPNREKGGDFGGSEKGGDLGEYENEGDLEKIEEKDCEKASPEENVVVTLVGKEVDVPLVDKEDGGAEEACTKACSSGGTSKHEGSKEVLESPGGCVQDCKENAALENAEQIEQERQVEICMDGNGSSSTGEKDVLSSHELNDGCFQNDTNFVECIPDTTISEKDAGLEGANLKSAPASGIPIRQEASESRRCGLCGRRSDGKSPKRLVHDSADSDNEAYNGSSASDEPNYDVLDGFGDEPEWLGRLLGPIRDRFGITRIWVHQHCAVWSPEVYFAGLGCLKNVRAALCRGRALKCCRCGRPGATIGCRVDRCPKTYHLPCARATGCIFDHRKFLIACLDHRHLFQPQGNLYLHHVKKLKVKKLKLDMKKQSNEASRKDLEAEERWLENCGEDEEFLKRESKRLHRDVLRIAPIYIGGPSSENNNLFQGWEAVAGLQGVIQCLKEVVILPLIYPEVFGSLGLTPPRGVLLHGYPGTGKTMVVRSLIGECSRGNKRIAYFARKGADCLGKYVGDAERQLRLLFQAAERLQPSIIFFDEIDGLAPCRSRRQDQTHNSVVSTLLSLMDGLKSRGSVIVIGATNRPDSVDPALRRPGRFDREIYFPLPSIEDRSAILSLHTKNWPKPLSEPALPWIAKETVGYAGADLQALCTQAAMIALKRNCPLQELLSSAEKGFRSDSHPSLPSFVVEEGDWLAALECSPPPCSRREAGMAANSVTLSPLQSHLLPCLLYPLSQLLISIYLDERIWLPPVLLRASKLMKNVIFSRMEQENIPHAFWMSRLRSLIHKQEVALDMERTLSRTGLLVGPSFSLNMPNGVTANECSESDSHRIKTDSRRFGNLMQKALGFRLLITGSPRSGQHHLATSLIHGFIGDVEIQKINLATISQEGNGDIILGVTHILLKCLSLKRCVLYLPRIDLWAADEIHKPDSIEKDLCVETLKSGKYGECDETKKPSRVWESFVEQVDSACASSLIILATTEMQIHDLPVGVRQFFTGSLLKTNNSVFSEHTVPRFCVQLDENFDNKLLIDLYSAKLSQDLIQQYVLRIHRRYHCGSTRKVDKTYEPTEGELQDQSQTLQSTEATEAIDSERIFSNNAASSSDKEINFTDYEMRQTSTARVRANEVYIQGHNHDSLHSNFPPNKVLKGNLMLAIASFGYQILRFPHFAELCWATSRLKEGPSFHLTGSWKVWPFNSCIMRPTGSPSKICKDSKNFGVVRGLIAVGLQAYRGGYTSMWEVSFEVRKVLDLIVAEINAKILDGKDRYRFLRILSQVAYLEDIVRSWAYAFRSLQIESPALESKTTQVDEKQFTDCQGNKNEQPDNDDYPPNLESNCSVEQVILESQILPSENGDCINQSSGLIPKSEPSKMTLSSTPFPCGPAASEEPSRVEVLVNCSQIRSETAEVSNALHMTESCIVTNLHNADGGISDCCATHNAVVLSVDVDANRSDQVIKKTSPTLENNISDNHTSVTMETSCVYECCSQCLHVVHVLTRKLLTNYWESNGCCSTVEDIHDVLGSCSAKLLAATSGCYATTSCKNFEVHSNKRCTSQIKQCSCQYVVDDALHDKIPFAPNRSNDIMLSTKECSCHPREVGVTATADTCSLCQQPLKFFFRNNTLVPSNPSQDTEFHCYFSRLCLCYMIDGMLTCEQPPS